MTTFEQFNLPKSVQKAIDDLGFVTPTPIQEKSFKIASTSSVIVAENKMF